MPDQGVLTAEQFEELIKDLLTLMNEVMHASGDAKSEDGELQSTSVLQLKRLPEEAHDNYLQYKNSAFICALTASLGSGKSRIFSELLHIARDPATGQMRLSPTPSNLAFDPFTTSHNSQTRVPVVAKFKPGPFTLTAHYFTQPQFDEYWGIHLAASGEEDDAERRPELIDEKKRVIHQASSLSEFAVKVDGKLMQYPGLPDSAKQFLKQLHEGKEPAELNFLEISGPFVFLQNPFANEPTVLEVWDVSEHFALVCF